MATARFSTILNKVFLGILLVYSSAIYSELLPERSLTSMALSNASISNEYLHNTPIGKTATPAYKTNSYSDIEKSNPVAQYANTNKLQELLKKYIYLSQKDYWKPLHFNEVPAPGEFDDELIKLRSNLSLTGDYRKDSPSNIKTSLASHHKFFLKERIDPSLFDQELENSLRNFQQRHGLEETGLLDKKTLKHLKTSPFEIAQKIAVNLQRKNQFPSATTDKYLIANLADFNLRLVNQDRNHLEMKVIVGRKYRPTPTMMDQVSAIILNPIWNVPPKIAALDLLPAIKKDPDYLVRKDFKVLTDWQTQTEIFPNSINWRTLNSDNFAYRLQQQPGPQNALGQIKFYISNDRAIYLHDTSQKQLFAKQKRTFSSGCIRLEKPMELALELLESDPAWNEATIEEYLTHRTTIKIGLKNPVPVYLTYWTAWVDDKGILQLRDDVYDNDKKLLSDAANLVATVSNSSL